MNEPEPLPLNATPVDVQLASAYYPLLVEVARQRTTITYGELVKRAKKAYPDNDTVQKAIPVSTGRRLDVVRQFTRPRGLPDLTTLVINQNRRECGPGLPRNIDPDAGRKEVFAYDWSAEIPEFQGYVTAVERAIRPRAQIGKDAAEHLMWRYYKEHKEELPASIKESRELIVEIIMEGLGADEAFAQARKLND